MHAFGCKQKKLLPRGPRVHERAEKNKGLFFAYSVYARLGTRVDTLQDYEAVS